MAGAAGKEGAPGRNLTAETPLAPGQTSLPAGTGSPRQKGIAYEKVIAAKGSPFPFLRKESREELRQVTASAGGAQAGSRTGVGSPSISGALRGVPADGGRRR